MKDKDTARLLLGPGPSNVDPRVLNAMSRPLLGHLDPKFLTMMDEVRSMLKQLFRTENELTFAVSGTGSAGMEACLVNLLEPGDEAIVCINGVFGGRMKSIIERCGAVPIEVNAKWGRAILAEDVMEALAQSKRPRLLAIVHAETSTGVRQPLEEIGMMAREAGALFVVDTVTSLGGIDVSIDEWGIDAVYSGTQKCLSAPPGLAPVSFGPRAVARIDERTRPVQSWYLDASMLRSYWGEERAYHHTAPISSVYALHEALRLVLEEGLEARFERHRSNHMYLRDAMENLGFRFVVDETCRLPMLNAVWIPEGLDDQTCRKRLLDEFNIEVGGGLGDFKGKIWRIGLMGYGCKKENVDLLINALRSLMSR
jgi:alanine-glyoxylate transaminase/serine-glyoxylate transaminase/serine-pyruvate transaminase